MRRSASVLLSSIALGVMLAGTAAALPIELRDQNGTRYFVNTDVDPLITQSTASGAVTDATFTRPVTVTSYWIGFTPWFGWTTVYTVQWTLNVPLTNAFAGFNGMLVTAVNGQTLPVPLVFNPGEVPAGEDCMQDNQNRQIIFPTQDFPSVGLSLTRKVFVSHNAEFARWMNIVTNTGTSPVEVAITLRGQLGSDDQTLVTATSTGDSTIGATDLWFATAQQVPQGTFSLQPKIGFVVQGEGATSPVASAGINGSGTVATTYTPTIDPGESATILTFVTVQGSSKQAKKVPENLVTLPSSSIQCMTTQELIQVVNFAPITQPELKKSTLKLYQQEKKVDQDTVSWKGSITIGAGVALEGQVVTVDVGGATQTFTLDDKGKADNGDGNKFKIKAKLKNGVTKADNVKFNFHMKGDFKTLFEAYGLVDETVSDEAVTVPISMSAAGRTFAVEQPFTYNAKQGKTGTAKVKADS